jgi:leader peptidase (prepilin peptidase)/N-methyltransferase
METVIPFAGVGFVLGWPLERMIQRFPLGEGTAPSAGRRWVVAAITAVLFALEAVVIGLEPALAPALLLTALVVPASAIDLRHRIIPDAINLPGALGVYVVAVAAQPDRWLELLLGGLGGALFLGLAWVVSPSGMGLGDVKMALMIGFACGRYTIIALLVALVLASIPGVAMMCSKGLKARKLFIPFGPFLATGAVVALLWGPQLWSLWLTGSA